ncbi:hypothetical protein [Halalkalibacter krulwichiae]|uniref:Uncharacterized protein n=1 Tax=Halalkalibacter krulwichiae TaxID=199441 RepID=A0A1X9M5Q3_9BACI|nr:hypothetical protein [Halalkalibacter krulwichiae]ARK28777.1 hypothetical protein BkAM31D_02320 [Halalkalibacter krulwichiae]
MLIAFQIILLILTLICGLGAIAEKKEGHRKQIVAILLAAVVAMLITIYF